MVSGSISVYVAADSVPPSDTSEAQEWQTAIKSAISSSIVSVLNNNTLDKSLDAFAFLSSEG